MSKKSIEEHQRYMMNKVMMLRKVRDIKVDKSTNDYR